MSWFEEFENHYVKVVDYLYLGDKKAAKGLILLQKLGIKHIINVTPSKTLGGVHNCFESNKQFNYLRIPVIDSDQEDIYPYFNECITFISNNIKHGNPVLVHCQQV